MKNSKCLPKSESNLYKLRKSRPGLTQEKIAKKLNCTAKTYANYERNTDDSRYQKPYIDHLITLAKMFKVSTDYILGLSKCRAVDNGYISKKTGLSDDSINELRRNIKLYDFDFADALNMIINNPKGKILLNDIYLYLCNDNGYMDLPDDSGDAVSLDSLRLMQVQADLVNMKSQVL